LSSCVERVLVVVLEVFERIAEIDGRLNVFMVWRGEREGTQLQLVAGEQQPEPAQLRSEALFLVGASAKKGAQWAREPKRGSKKQGLPLPLALARPACEGLPVAGR
jgi:hypothetical protein